MRGSATVLDRIFSVLSYAMPLVPAIGAGSFFLPLLAQQSPQLAKALSVLLVPFIPLMMLETSPVLSFLVFIALYALVVRSTSVSRFIRFNVLQAIILSILLSVCLMILGIPGIGGSNILGATLTNVIFFASMTAIIYAMVRSALGKYAELPVICDAVYPQLL